MTIKKFKELRKKQKEVRRQTIVETAEEILQRRGFEAITIRSVAKAVGCSVGSIYVYFKNKEELFLCMLLEHLSRLNEDVEKSAKIKDPVHALKAMANDYRKYYLACGKHINALGFMHQKRREAGEINPDMLGELEEVLGGILSKIEHILSQPEMKIVLKGIPPERGIPVLWSIMTGLAELTLQSARADQAGFDFNQVLEDMFTLFLRDRLEDRNERSAP